MSVRKTIFDGVQEAGIARQLLRRWGAKVQVHPNLPLSKLFTEPKGLSERDRRFFFSTNVDYTLTDESGTPLMAIEFDGLSGGYSAPSGYVPGSPAPDHDPRRPDKLNFKLRLARDSAFPFYIVSFDEAMPKERLDGFTVIDDLIGQFLTNRRSRELAQEFVSDLPEDADDDAVQDAVLVADVHAELEMNPLEAFISKAGWFFGYKNQIRARIVKELEFEEPPAPFVKEMFDFAGLQARRAALKEAVLHGATVAARIEGEEVTVVRTVRVRAVGDWFAVRSAAKRIAKYLVWRSVYDHLGLEPWEPSDDTCEGET